jgi:hypothetical protein
VIKAILLTAAAVWIGLSLSVIVGLAKDGVPSSRLNSTGANSTSQAPRPPLVSQDKAKPPPPPFLVFHFKLVAVKTISAKK